MENTCNHKCEECTNKCPSYPKDEHLIKKETLKPGSTVKKHIAVVSGKGGVGKSLVTSLLAVALRRMESSVSIIDADITGPSIPKAFGLDHVKILQNEAGLVPATSKTGINIISLNLLLQDKTDPVVWRGPILAGVVKQFYTDVCWGNVDFMLIDMPPGTGDIPLTVYQSLPIDGIIVVTSPQELVSMIVNKAIKMANLMGVPVLGLIENMSYFQCPKCGCKHNIFGESTVNSIAKQYSIDLVAKVPINPEFSKLTDKGLIELHEADYLLDFASTLHDMLELPKEGSV